MKSIRLFIIIVLITNLINISCKNKPSIVPRPEKKMVVVVDTKALLEKEKTWPTDLQVIQSSQVDSKATIKRLSDILKLRGKIEETEEHFRLVEGERYLEVNKISNASFYGEMNKLWTQGPIPGSKMKFEVPDDTRAKEMALEYLNNLGFSQEALHSAIIEIVPEVFEILKPNEKTPSEVIVGKTVTLRRKINNLPVVGPGSKIKVYCAGNGGIAGWLSVWRPFQIDFKPAYIVSGDTSFKQKMSRRMQLTAAIEQLKKNPLDHMLIEGVEEVIVKDVQLLYYEKSASERQQYLQPVYSFVGVMRGGKDTRKPFELPYKQFILAIEKPYEALWEKGIDYKSKPRSKLVIPVDKDEEVTK